MSISSFKIANKLITGEGATSRIPSELARLKINNPLIITDKILIEVGTVKKITNLLKGIPYGIFDGVLPEPEFSLAKECTETFINGGYDGLIAIGGGSAIDIAKAVSAFSKYEGNVENLVGTDLVPAKGAPIIAVPTTAGTGSEVTNISILSDSKTQLKKEL